MSDRVKDKVVIVTGAASGLGEADARFLAAEGAKVVLTDVNIERGEQIASELDAVFFPQDVSDEATWEQLIKKVSDDYGRLNALVNNAGIAIIENIENSTTDNWRKTINIHLDGTYFGCRTAFPLIKASGGGSIVNMSSTAALIGIPSYLSYSAAKGGIRSLTKAVAVHSKNTKAGIRCNSVHPGSINTPMVQHALKTLMDVDLLASEDPEKKRKALGVGEPADVANMILYLVSDDSRHINGAEMVIDNADTVA